MMGSMNRVIRHLRDRRREYLETTKGLHGGPIFKENFQCNWSNVRYDRRVAARQDEFDWIFYDHRADHLVDDAIQPGQAMPLRDTWAQTRALVKGVAEIATTLNAAGLHYETRSSSETWSGIVLPGAWGLGYIGTSGWTTAGTPRTSVQSN
jgi:hypothetical protein